MAVLVVQGPISSQPDRVAGVQVAREVAVVLAAHLVAAQLVEVVVVVPAVAPVEQLVLLAPTRQVPEVPRAETTQPASVVALRF